MNLQVEQKSEDMGAMERKPKVSVCVMTYNQKKFIRECLQSIVDQKADFAFEVIVGDDCSTDGTREIVQEFVDKYPNLVRAVLHKKNVGVGENYRSVHDLAIGEYVAHCDGDDIWLPGKLSYQANLLDKNTWASQCWGCAYLIDDDGKRIGIFPSRLARLLYPNRISARHIALSYALVGQHSTHMYRRTFKFNFDKTKPVLDFWIAFNMAIHGDAIYSKKILGGYRMTRTPSMTRLSNKKKPTVDFLAMHLAEIIKKHPEFAREAKSNLYVRRLFSALKGHSLSVIDEVIKSCAEVSANPVFIMRSMYYFLLQKIY